VATTISSVLGNHGALPKLVDPDTGRTWEFRFIDYEVMTEYEQWLRGEAFKAVMAQRGLVPDESYKELLREVSQDVASGAYSYEGALCRRSVGTPGGAVALAAMLMRDAKTKRHPSREELSDVMRRRGEEVNAVIELIGEESRQRLRPPGGDGEEADQSTNPPQAAATASTPS
jgi:hypothetical protein